MKTAEETLSEINETHKKIRELEYFISTIDPDKNVHRAGSYDINAVLKVKTVKSYSIFGSRWFGAGTHESEIQIPNSLIGKLNELASERLSELKDKLNSILSVKQELK